MQVDFPFPAGPREVGGAGEAGSGARDTAGTDTETVTVTGDAHLHDSFDFPLNVSFNEDTPPPHPRRWPFA